MASLDCIRSFPAHNPEGQRVNRRDCSQRQYRVLLRRSFEHDIHGSEGDRLEFNTQDDVLLELSLRTLLHALWIGVVGLCPDRAQCHWCRIGSDTTAAYYDHPATQSTRV